MYAKVVVPLDGSHWSEEVIPYARLLAKALALDVELLQIIDPDRVLAFSDPEHGRYVDLVGSTMKNETANYLQKTGEKYFDTTRVICSAEVGKPAEVIVDKAAASPDALIAMSTHGRPSIPRWLLGSVAHKVLQAAANPLLLVRPAEEGPPSVTASFNKVFVPLDGSPIAESTLPHVKELAKVLDIEVVLVRSWEQTVQGHVPFTDRALTRIREEAKAYIESKVKQLEADGIKRISYLVPQGNAAEKIVDIARATPNCLIVICTHGKSGIGRWMLGSVTDHVVRRGGSPVLVVRAVG